MPKLSLKKIIGLAVKTEEMGFEYYTRMAERFADKPEVGELFSGLAKDEMSHKTQFSELLKITPDLKWDEIDSIKEGTLVAMSLSEYFHPTNSPFKDIESIKDPDRLVEMAFNFEKATLAFYQAMAEVVGHHHKVLNKLISTEKRHVIALLKILLTHAKFRSLSDPWLFGD